MAFDGRSLHGSRSRVAVVSDTLSSVATVQNKSASHALNIAYCLVKSRPNAIHSYDLLAKATSGGIDFGRPNTIVILPHVRPFSTIASIPVVEELRAILAEEATLLDTETRSVWSLQLDVLTVLNTLSQLGFRASHFDINANDGVHTWAMACSATDSNFSVKPDYDSDACEYPYTTNLPTKTLNSKVDSSRSIVKRRDYSFGFSTFAEAKAHGQSFEGAKRQQEFFSVADDEENDGVGGSNGSRRNINNKIPSYKNRTSTISNDKHVLPSSRISHAEGSLQFDSGKTTRSASVREKDGDENSHSFAASDDENSHSFAASDDDAARQSDDQQDGKESQQDDRHTRNSPLKKVRNGRPLSTDAESDDEAHRSLKKRSKLREHPDFKPASAAQTIKRIKPVEPTSNQKPRNALLRLHADQQLLADKLLKRREVAGTAAEFNGTAKEDDAGDSNDEPVGVSAPIKNDSGRPPWMNADGLRLSRVSRHLVSSTDVSQPFRLETEHAVLGQPSSPSSENPVDGCYYAVIKFGIQKARLIALADSEVPTYLSYENEPADLQLLDADIDTKLPLTYVFDNKCDPNGKFFCLVAEKIRAVDASTALMRLQQLFLQMQGTLNDGKVACVDDLQDRVQWVRQICFEQYHIAENQQEQQEFSLARNNKTKVCYGIRDYKLHRPKYSCDELAQLHAVGQPYLCSSVGRVDLGTEDAPFCVNLLVFMDQFRKLRLRSVHPGLDKVSVRHRARVTSQLLNDLLRYSKSGMELWSLRWTTHSDVRSAAHPMSAAYKTAVADAFTRLLNHLNTYIERRNAREIDKSKIVRPLDVEQESSRISHLAQNFFVAVRMKPTAPHCERLVDVTVGWDEAAEFAALCEKYPQFRACEESDGGGAISLSSMLAVLDDEDEVLRERPVVSGKERDQYELRMHERRGPSMPRHLKQKPGQLASEADESSFTIQTEKRKRGRPKKNSSSVSKYLKKNAVGDEGDTEGDGGVDSDASV